MSILYIVAVEECGFMGFRLTVIQYSLNLKPLVLTIQFTVHTHVFPVNESFVERVICRWDLSHRYVTGVAKPSLASRDI
jgi:hypothetical protein